MIKLLTDPKHDLGRFDELLTLLVIVDPRNFCSKSCDAASSIGAVNQGFDSGLTNAQDKNTTCNASASISTAFLPHSLSDQTK